MPDNTKLARAMAGLKRNPFEIPYQGLHNEPYPLQQQGPPPLPPFALTGAQGDPRATRAGAAPFNLGQGPPPGPPQIPPQGPPPMPPQSGLPPLDGTQGFGGPEPPPGSVPPPYDPNMDPRFLPEQWRGAFNNWQGR